MLWHKTLTNNKPPLVLIHGWGFSADIFKTIIPQLMQHYQLTLLDLPGHGRSQIVGGNFEGWIEAILPIIPHNAHIVGWSLGGLLAIRLAQLCCTKRLHLIASSPCFVKKNNWQYGIDKNHIEQFSTALSTNFSKALKNFVQLQLVPKVQLPQLIKSIEQYPAQLSALKIGLKILQHTDLRKNIKQLSVPITATLGAKDTLISAKIQSWYEVHNITYQILPSGHLPFLHPHFKL